MTVFHKTMEFRGKYFLMEKSILITFVKSLTKKVGVDPQHQRRLAILSPLQSSEKVILMSAIRLVYPLLYLESQFKKYFGMNLYSTLKTFKNFETKIKVPY